MLCGRCKKPLYCEYCGDIEYSQELHDRHKFIPSKCECEKIKRYVNKDEMWYIKSALEAIMIFIGVVCLLGSVIGFAFVLIAIPMVWGEPLSYQPFPWLNHVMAWSICVGLVNLLFMFSVDNEWRESYEDHSTVFNIREKRSG